MSWATRSGAVAGERAAWSAEAVIERDGGGEGGEAHREADAEVVDRGSVRGAARSRVCRGVGGGGSARRAQRGRLRTPGRGSAYRRSESASDLVGAHSERPSAGRRSSRQPSGRSTPTSVECRPSRRSRATESSRRNGYVWRNSRSRRHRPAGCGGWSQRFARTPQAWNQRAARRRKAGAVTRELDDQRLDHSGQSQPPFVKGAALGQSRD
jgi:hypothetical protein